MINHRPSAAELENTFTKGKSTRKPEQIAYSKLNFKEDDYFVNKGTNELKRVYAVIVLPRTESTSFDYSRIYSNSDTELLLRLKTLLKNNNKYYEATIGKYYEGETTASGQRFSDKSYVIRFTNIDKEELNNIVKKLKEITKSEALLADLEDKHELKII